MTPLLYAARDGRIESAKLLLERGAAIDAADANGITPLLTAIANNHPAMALLLIERGANVRAVDWYGRTPLWAAVEARNMDVDNATFVNSVDRAPLLPVIEALLAKGVDVNARMLEHPPIRRHMLPITGTLAWVDFTGQTAFLAAALAADLDVMRLLLKHGADPRIPTFGGTTALMAAAGVNWVVDQTFDEGPAARLAAVTLCHELGLDVNAVNSMGLTALHGAANRGSDDIIRFLVEKGARLDVKDKEGPHAADVGRGRVPGDASFPAQAQLDRAHHVPAGRPSMRRCVSRGGSASSSSPSATLGAGQAPAPAGKPARPARSLIGRAARPTPAFLAKYCVTCHNPRAKTGGLSLEAEGLTHVGTDVEVWEKVVRKLRTGMMPPIGMPRPDARDDDGVHHRARGPARRREPARPPPRHAGVSAPQPHRVRQRGPRSAGRGRGRARAAAGRRLERRLRQHRRGADGLALAGPGLRGGGAEDQPAARSATARRRRRRSRIRRRASGCTRSTSRACRSARAAACWSRTRFRWTRSTSCRSAGGGPGGLAGSAHRHHARRPAAHGAPTRALPAADHGGPAHASAWRWWIGQRGAGVDDTFSDHPHRRGVCHAWRRPDADHPRPVRRHAASARRRAASGSSSAVRPRPRRSPPARAASSRRWRGVPTGARPRPRRSTR